MPAGIDLLRGMVGLARYNASTPKLVALHTILTREGTSGDHPLHDYFVTRCSFVFDLLCKGF